MQFGIRGDWMSKTSMGGKEHDEELTGQDRRPSVTMMLTVKEDGKTRR